MKLKVKLFRHVGDLARERVVLVATHDCDISSVLVMASESVTPAEVSVGAMSCYWFPVKNVKAGDYVIIYTKAGMPSERKNTDGTTSCFFYWGRTASLWSGDKKACILVGVDEWDTVEVEDAGRAGT